MIFYGGLSKKRVLKIHSFVLEKREQLGFGQRRLFKLVRKRFSVEIKESTISGWIFRDIIPFEQEKTQFRPKPKLSKTVLFNLYFKKKISPDTIGEKYTVSGNTVRKWIIDYGGKTRTLTESMNSSITKKLLREQKLFIPKKSFSFIDPTTPLNQ